MKAQHTPGPWFVPAPTYRTLYVEARIGNMMLQEVAACGPTADPAQQAANARLIAAAPELLEALKLALEYWRHRQQRYKNRSPVWVQAARSAIAKATGENT